MTNYLITNVEKIADEKESIGGKVNEQNNDENERENNTQRRDT